MAPQDRHLTRLIGGMAGAVAASVERVAGHPHEWHSDPRRQPDAWVGRAVGAGPVQRVLTEQYELPRFQLKGPNLGGIDGIRRYGLVERGAGRVHIVLEGAGMRPEDHLEATVVKSRFGDGYPGRYQDHRPQIEIGPILMPRHLGISLLVT